MWNSPSKESEIGKRYRLEDLPALVLPLGVILPNSKVLPMDEVVEQPILQRLERDELVFALYQVFDALLEETAIPGNGHPGIQEALVAELLSQAHAMVCGELDLPELGDEARRTAWRSIDRLLIRHGQDSPDFPSFLEDAGVDLQSPEPYLAEQMDHEQWENILLGGGGLFDEFLWDTDWMMDNLMDLPSAATKPVTEAMGLNLGVVQSLPHTPSPAELEMAEHYLSYVIWKNETLDQQNAKRDR